MHPVWHTYSNWCTGSMLFDFPAFLQAPIQTSPRLYTSIFLLQIMRNSAAVQKALKNSVCPDLLSTP